MISEVADEFWKLWNFLPQPGSIFYNYKKFFSVVLQAMANSKFIAIEVMVEHLMPRSFIDNLNFDNLCRQIFNCLEEILTRLILL